MREEERRDKERLSDRGREEGLRVIEKRTGEREKSG